MGNGLLDGIARGITNGLNYQTSQTMERRNRQALLESNLEMDQAKFDQDNSPERMQTRIRQAIAEKQAEADFRRQQADQDKLFIVKQKFGTLGPDGKWVGGKYSEDANKNPDWVKKHLMALDGLEMPHVANPELQKLISTGDPDDIRKAYAMAAPEERPEIEKAANLFGQLASMRHKEAITNGNVVLVPDPKGKDGYKMIWEHPLIKARAENIEAGGTGRGGSGKGAKSGSVRGRFLKGEDGSWRYVVPGQAPMVIDTGNPKLDKNRFYSELRKDHDLYQKQIDQTGIESLSPGEQQAYKAIRGELSKKYTQPDKAGFVSPPKVVASPGASTVAPADNPGAAGTVPGGSPTDAFAKSQRQDNPGAGKAGGQMQNAAMTAFKELQRENRRR